MKMKAKRKKNRAFDYMKDVKRKRRKITFEFKGEETTSARLGVAQEDA